MKKIILILLSVSLVPMVVEGISKEEATKQLFNKLIFLESNNEGPIIKFIKDNDFDFNQQNNEGEILLTDAAFRTHASKELIQALLDKGADVNGVNKHKKTALILAASRRKKTVVDLLLKKSPKMIDNQDADGNTALIYAAVLGFPDIVDSLLKAGAKKDIRNKDGKTALDWATINKNREIINLLDLETAAKQKTEKATEALFTKLYEAIYGTGVLQYQVAILANDADVNALNSTGKTPLTLLADSDRTDIVEVLLDKKADINLPDKNGDTPLIVAVKNGKVAMVKFLLDRRADVNKRDANGNTALMKAVSVGENKEEIIKLLLEKGADKTLKNGGKTALDLAKERYNNETAIQLLEEKPTTTKEPIKTEPQKEPEPLEPVKIPEQKPIEEKPQPPMQPTKTIDPKATKQLMDTLAMSTDLFKTNQSYYIRMAKEAIDQGADVHTTNRDFEYIVLPFAIRFGNRDLIKLLLDAGAVDDINDKTRGSTPLIMAVDPSFGAVNIDVIKLLLHQPGIDVNARSDKGKTAFDIAREAADRSDENKKIFELLDRYVHAIDYLGFALKSFPKKA